MNEEEQIAGVIIHEADGGEVGSIIVHEADGDELALAALDAIQPCI